MEIKRETHLKLAFTMWGLVGSGLFIAGSVFLFGSRSLSVLSNEASNPGLAEGLGFLIALVLGFIKGNLVLKKLAKRYIVRIQGLPEISPLYMTFSRKSWIMIAGMIVIGRTIRALGAPHLVIGVVYVAVGFALVLGSRTYLQGMNTATEA